MASEILVNSGSENGMLPDGTKPLPETNHWSYLENYLFDSGHRSFNYMLHIKYQKHIVLDILRHSQ